MSKYAYDPGGEKPPAPTYSFGALAGNFVFTAGIVAIDAEGKAVHLGDAEAQTAYVLDVIGKILRAKDAGYDDVAMVHVYLKTMEDYQAMNRAYIRYFPDRPPPRFCVQTQLVREEWLVEIVAVAYREKGGAA